MSTPLQTVSHAAAPSLSAGRGDVRAIRVETDREGLKEAILWLFEETLWLGRLDSTLKNADEDAKARAMADMPDREISPGYFVRANYLLDLSLQIELGMQFTAASLTQAEVIGLAAVRAAKAEFEYEHPACPACGERQDNRSMKQCFKCGTKFAGRGN